MTKSNRKQTGTKPRESESEEIHFQPWEQSSDSEEIWRAFFKACEVGIVHRPLDLAQAWKYEAEGYPSIKTFVEHLRELVSCSELDDSASAADHLSQIFEGMTRQFEKMAECGLLDDVLPRLSSLPLLYSPDKSAGASSWARAKELYDIKKVGTKAFGQHRGSDSRVSFGECDMKKVGDNRADHYAPQKVAHPPRLN